MATTLAILEPFRNPISIEEIHDCLAKLLEVSRAMQREANRSKTKILDSEIPHLWILTTTCSKSIISRFSGQLKLNWGEGIYFLPKHFRTAIVVIHQLLSTSETLWIRLLGRSRVQSQAIDELTALPANHPFQRVTLSVNY